MKIFDKLQSISKALMLPVAVLPSAAILFRFGANDLLDIDVLEKAGGAIFDNLPVIFAIALAFGLSKDTNNNGAAAMAGFLCYSVFTASLKSINAEINMGILAGIISGVTTGYLYNRFYKTKLPEFLGFFGGRRFVPIITSLAAIVLAVIFGVIWLPIQEFINFIGEMLIQSGGIGTFFFGILNRLLIPTGLHHILGSLINFVVGEYKNPVTGAIVHGDLNRFFAGDPTAGIFMSGFFPIMMFGLPAITLAIYHTAKAENRAKIAGVLASMAFTSFLTGITEPIEFSFMFLAPILYVIHAILTGISMIVCYEAGVLVGFGFGPCFIDYVLNYGISTRPELIIPVGLGIGAIYYVIFRYAIVKLNLATLGREEENSAEKISDSGDLADKMIKGLGGLENLEEVGNCATRLRVIAKDSAKVDEKFLKSAGAKGIFRKENAIQVVIGTNVEFVADEIKTRR